MKPVIVSISYLDAISGGSGLISLDLLKLGDWLREHPGCLVRRIDMPLTWRDDRGIA